MIGRSGYLRFIKGRQRNRHNLQKRVHGFSNSTEFMADFNM